MIGDMARIKKRGEVAPPLHLTSYFPYISSRNIDDRRAANSSNQKQETGERDHSPLFWILAMFLEEKQQTSIAKKMIARWNTER